MPSAMPRHFFFHISQISTSDDFYFFNQVRKGREREREYKAGSIHQDEVEKSYCINYEIEISYKDFILCTFRSSFSPM